METKIKQNILIPMILIMTYIITGCSNQVSDTAKRSAEEITAFSFSVPETRGAINETEKTITLKVPSGTVLTQLVPTIAHNGVSLSPASDVPQDFTNPIDYTLTAADGTTKKYRVSVVTSLAMQVQGESLVLPSTIPGNLCFDKVISGSVVVRSTYKADAADSIVYQENVDYILDYPNGTITRTKDSKIPDFATNVLYGRKDFDHGKFPGFTNHPFFVWVDYETINGEKFAKPNDQTQYLKNARAKLEAGGPFKIVYYGDSITAGEEASSQDLRFQTLYAEYLQTLFPATTIQVEDVSLSGHSSTEAVEWWDSYIGKTSPDLVLMGWGMNDHNIGGNTPEQFKQNLIKLVEKIKRQKHADVIIFSSSPPNSDWHYSSQQMNLFAEATRQAAAEAGCAYVDVYDTWAMVLQRKDQPSLLGNNINHPNNFGHWLYEQALEAMIF